MGLFNAILGNASEVNTQNVASEFEPLLIDGETIEKAYKLIRDMFVKQFGKSGNNINEVYQILSQHTLK